MGFLSGLDALLRYGSSLYEMCLQQRISTAKWIFFVSLLEKSSKTPSKKFILVNFRYVCEGIVKELYTWEVNFQNTSW